MTTASQLSLQTRVVQRTLSLPVQASLFTALCALTLWTVYFTTYPTAHDRLHGLRHNTAAVACH